MKQKKLADLTLAEAEQLFSKVDNLPFTQAAFFFLVFTAPMSTETIKA